MVALSFTQDSGRYEAPQRGPDGKFKPVEEVQMPMNGAFIRVGGLPDPSRPGSAPPLPPKDYPYAPEVPDQSFSSSSRGPSVSTQDHHPPPYTHRKWSGSSFGTSTTMGRMTAVERSHNLRAQQMDPHLQLMVGPLLRYDTVDEQGVWNGAVMVVSE